MHPLVFHWGFCRVCINRICNSFLERKNSSQNWNFLKVKSGSLWAWAPTSLYKVAQPFPVLVTVTDKTCLFFTNAVASSEEFWPFLGICNSPYVMSFLTSAILLCYQKRVLVETILKIVTQRLHIFFWSIFFLEKLWNVFWVSGRKAHFQS